MSTGSIVKYVVAGIVVAALIYIFQFDGMQQIKEAIKRPEIEVRSPSRPFAEEFMTGEKLRFSLGNVESSSVFWVFDEESVERGNIEIEYGFAYSPDTPLGQADDHRIDAFYKIDGAYRSTSRYIRVENLDVQARLQAAIAELEVSFPAKFDERFSLSGVFLTSFADGEFSQSSALDPAVGIPSIDPITGTSLLVWNLDQKTREEYLGMIASARSPWVQLEFTSAADGEKLVLVEPLTARN